MSLIKPSFGIAAISGKVGGTVYARNRGGLYSRAWVDPTNPATPDQTDKRNTWIDSAAAFKSLTYDELNQWHTYATQIQGSNRLGIPIRLTAQQLFTECYTNASLAGLTPLTRPTQFTNRPAIKTATFTALSDGSGTISKLIISDLTSEYLSSTVPVVLIFASPITSPTIRNVNNQFRLLAFGAADGTDIQFQDEYIAKFGHHADIGQLAHAKLRLIDSETMLGSTRYLIDAIVT